MKYGIRSDFNLELHKKTFINYLEAVILPSGVVQYAIPSHLEKLREIAGWSIEELSERCPVWESPLEFLITHTECIAVWSKFTIGSITTSEQSRTLDLLISEGLTV
jgi:hypothetical protein